MPGVANVTGVGVLVRCTTGYPGCPTCALVPNMHTTRGVVRGRLVSSVLRSSVVVGVSQLGKDSDSIRGLGVGRKGVRKNSYSRVLLARVLDYVEDLWILASMHTITVGTVASIQL